MCVDISTVDCVDIYCVDTGVVTVAMYSSNLPNTGSVTRDVTSAGRKLKYKASSNKNISFGNVNLLN